MRKNRSLTWWVLGVAVLASAVWTAVLIRETPRVAPLLKARGATSTAQVDDASTIMLVVTPASAARGTTETLTATVTPSTAAGVVQFNDSSSPLGDPVTLIDGTATTTTTLPAGEHFLIADFTPTDSTAFSGSTSNTVDYSLNTVPATGSTITTITLDVTPASPAQGITTETLTATVTPSTAAGTVQFNEGSNHAGDPVP